MKDRAHFRLLLLSGCAALLAWGAGCASDTGLAYQNLWLQASELGTSSAPVSASQCTTLPRLIGSEVDQQLSLGAIVVVHVAATRDAVTVSFTNTKGGAADTRTISAQELDSAFAQSFQIDGVSGPSYSIALGSKCQ